MHASFVDVADKKRKKAQEGKGTKGAKKGEVTHSSHQPPAKEAGTSRGQQNKSASTGTFKEKERDRPPKLSVWSPIFILSSSSPVLSDANLRDHKKAA